MILKNEYVVGCLVQFYEVEMLPEYLESCIQMMEGIENPENVTFHFTIGMQEYFEEIDDPVKVNGRICEIFQGFNPKGNRPILEWKFGPAKLDIPNFNGISNFYNIARYRRDLNYKWCERVDYVLWGETDSLWPKQTLELIEAISSMVDAPKHIISFAYRVNWDSSWDVTRHPMFELEQFKESDDWVLNNEASEKSYMTLERMNEINNVPLDQVEIVELVNPKADGSCLVISSELIKAGVNIPHALLLCGEDESFLRVAKHVMGRNFRQYLVKNILRVHNRRHPKKRMYIKDENNPRGFCDDRKGSWWKPLENASKWNLENLTSQTKFRTLEDVIRNT